MSTAASVEILSPENGMLPVWSIRVCEGDLWHVAWHPSGKFMAYSLPDRMVQIVDVSGNLLLSFPTDHTKHIRRLDWDRSGKRLCVCSFDGKVSIFAFRVLDKLEGEISVSLLESIEGHESEVKSVAFHPTENFLATCGRDKTIWIWEYCMTETDEDTLPSTHEVFSPSLFENNLDGDLCSQRGFRFHIECVAVLEEHSGDVKTVLWSPSEEHELISCSYDQMINVWKHSDDTKNSEEWALDETLKGNKSTVWDAATSVYNNTKYLVSVSANATLMLWQNASDNWKYVDTFTGIHADEILSCHFNSNHHLVTASRDNSVCITDFAPVFESLRTQRDEPLRILSRKIIAHDCDVNIAKWSPQDPRLLISCGEDGFLKLWRIPESL